MERAKALESIRALEGWAKRVTNGYRDVDVRDMAASFRDGLAFCAIVHKFRPDLIDFESLSKENIYENNSLAFSVAEKQLGVPALLDAEDMVKYARPDRLSIITYLSQLHNCFENQNKVNNMKSGVKRVQSSNIGPPAKVPVVRAVPLTKTRHEVCTVCNHRVFILERLIVDGKLYHRTCFRCSKCNCLLNPGTYIEGDTPGVYECSVCPTEENSDSMESEDTESKDSLEDKTPETFRASRTSLQSFQETPPSQSLASVRVSSARNSFLRDSLQNGESTEKSPSKASVRDKISVFESSNQKPRPSSFLMKTSSASLRESSEPSARRSLILTSPDREPKAPELKESTKPASSAITVDTPSPVQDNSTSECKSASTTPPSEVTSPEPRSTSSSISSPPERKRFQLGDYKSPLQGSRDIFKTNFQPLRLSLDRKVDGVTPLSPVLSPDSAKVLPQIRSVLSARNQQERSFSMTAGQVSVTDGHKTLEPKRSVSVDEDLPSAVHSGDHSPVPRKGSLDSTTTSPKTLLTPDSKSLSDEKVESTGSSQTPLPIPSVRQSLLLNKNSDKPPSDVRTLHETTIDSKEPPKLTNSTINEKPSPIIDSMPKGHPKTTLINSTVDKKSSPVIDSTPKGPPKTTLTKPDKDYPDDLNPFGDEEEQYPDDLNPFGDDDNDESEAVVVTKLPVTSPKLTPIKDYDESMNPFASDDDDDNSSGPPPRPPPPRPSYTSSTPNKLPSPTGSMRGTLKKRMAPRPPNVADIFPNDSQDISDVSAGSSLRSSPAVSRKSFNTSSPKLRKNKPAPPPPPSPMQPPANDKQAKDASNTKLKTTPLSDEDIKSKKKKRPAPPVPIPKRLDNTKIPLKEILREMKEIEQKQRQCEQQGREIELLIRDKDKDEEASVEEEEYIMQLFELVNQKNALFRRRAELMYIKRSQRLEEQQADIETQIRLLLERPESEKTEEDRNREEELILELKDVVDQRSSIIDSIEMDRRREMEEDVSIQEQTEMKNGDLPIAAEIKEKSSGKKEKKDKKKKEKKKKEKDKEEHKDSAKKEKKKKWFPK